MSVVGPETSKGAPSPSRDTTRVDPRAKMISVREIVLALILLAMVALVAILGVSYATARVLATAQKSISSLNQAASSSAAAQQEATSAASYLSGIRDALAGSATTLTDITAGDSAGSAGIDSLKTAGTEGCKLLHIGH